MAVTFFTRSSPNNTGDRRFPSPSAQFRSGEQWRVRLGLGFATLLTLFASAALWQAFPHS